MAFFLIYFIFSFGVKLRNLSQVKKRNVLTETILIVSFFKFSEQRWMGRMILTFQLSTKVTNISLKFSKSVLLDFISRIGSRKI